ncbi:hypothetical protein VTK56DRAFT_1291 [Thermocarpiscus australiensis]
MPALPSLTPFDVLANPNTVTNHSLSAGKAVVNSTSGPAPLPVICAWPVSGQYGPGSRILYYVLVAACLLARKTEWLRNACLAAALIFPAVAAIHGIVLAALHVDDAVDMDVYGAFQLCSIGILTAPATVRLSSTYFNNPGRNTIFAWTVMVLAGLLALTVEFFRSTPTPCTDGGSGQPLYNLSDFEFGRTTCGLTCSVEEGPFSPMRNGSANNIYVVPAPTVLTFGTATLLAAASCIPAILSMVSMWDKILRINWKERFGGPDADELIEGTNGATVGKMKSVNDMIRAFLSVVEIPLFGAAVLAIIIVGEMNFWSDQVEYETEPMANVGQWAPIVASSLAACGSLYMLLAEDVEAAGRGEGLENSTPNCNCPCHDCGNSRPTSGNGNDGDGGSPRRPQPEKRSTSTEIPSKTTPLGHSLTQSRTNPQLSDDAVTQPDMAPGLGIYAVETHMTEPGSSKAGRRREVAEVLRKIALTLGTASPDRFDDYEFKHGKANAFPVVPGEENRNSKLNQIKEQWGHHDADEHDSLAPRGRRSRAGSFSGSMAGAAGISRSGSVAPREHSPQPPELGSARASSLLALPSAASPDASRSTDAAFTSAPVSADLTKPKPLTSVVAIHSGGQNSPSIVISSENESGDTPGLGGVPSSTRPRAERMSP